MTTRDFGVLEVNAIKFCSSEISIPVTGSESEKGLPLYISDLLSKS